MSDLGSSLKNSFHNANVRLSQWDYRQKMLCLVLISIIVYGFLIYVDVFYLRGWIELNFGVTDDLHFYQERGQAILDGKILYKDLYVESPPLINYLFVIPQFFGGSAWMYQVFFSVFPLMQALITYAALRKWNDNCAFILALFALLSPYSVLDATWGIQDEPIVTFFYTIPIILMLYGLTKSSAIIDTIAFWVKGLPIIIFPNLLIRMKNNKERLMGILLAVVVSLIIFVPIMVASGQSFFDIFQYYMLSDDDLNNVSGGISIINFITRGGYFPPGYVGLILTAAALLASYYLACRWKLDIWRSALLTTVSFMCVFSMLRFGYFAIPFFFLAPWLMKGSLSMWGRFILFYAISFIAQGIESKDVSWLTFDYSWLISIGLMIVSFLLLLDMVRLSLKTKCFLDEIPAEASS